MKIELLEIDNTLWTHSDNWEAIAMSDPQIPLTIPYHRKVRNHYKELNNHFSRPRKIEVRGLRNIVIIEAHWGIGTESQSEVHKLAIRRLHPKI